MHAWPRLFPDSEHAISSDRDRALILLVVGALLYCGYQLFSGIDRGMAWQASGSAVRLGLLLALAWHWRGRVLVVIGWFAFEESLVIGCSIGYIIRPWDVPVGMDQCSALVGFDLSVLSAWIMVSLLVWLVAGR